MIGFLWKLVYTGYWGRWLRIRYHILKIQNDEFQTVATETKNADKISENVYSGVFLVAVYESYSDLKITMVDLRWRPPK